MLTDVQVEEARDLVHLRHAVVIDINLIHALGLARVPPVMIATDVEIALGAETDMTGVDTHTIVHILVRDLVAPRDLADETSEGALENLRKFLEKKSSLLVWSRS